MFLLYRALAYSADCPVAVAAYQFLRYRGRVRNENLAVFLLHRFVRELAVCCCAAQTDFLPYRIAEKQAKPDDLLLAARLPCLELAQRCFAVVQTRPVPSAPVRWCCDTTFLRDRSAEQ